MDFNFNFHVHHHHDTSVVMNAITNLKETVMTALEQLQAEITAASENIAAARTATDKAVDLIDLLDKKIDEVLERGISEEAVKELSVQVKAAREALITDVTELNEKIAGTTIPE